MRIGIYVFSLHGHTKILAESIKEKLNASGHLAEVVAVEPVGQMDFTGRAINIKPVPSIEEFDALAIGSPVHGGRLSAPIVGLLQEISSFEGKPTVCFATHFFPSMWGGRQMVEKLKETCTEKKADVVGTTSVCWLGLHRQKNIAIAAQELSALLSRETN